jgi:hypothetical protein
MESDHKPPINSDRDDISAPLKLEMAHIEDAEESMMAGKTYRIWGLLGKMPEEISAVMQTRIWSGVMDRILSQQSSDFFGTEMFHVQSRYAHLNMVPDRLLCPTT